MSRCHLMWRAPRGPPAKLTEVKVLRGFLPHWVFGHPRRSLHVPTWTQEVSLAWSVGAWGLNPQRSHPNLYRWGVFLTQYAWKAATAFSFAQRLVHARVPGRSPQWIMNQHEFMNYSYFYSDSYFKYEYEWKLHESMIMNYSWIGPTQHNWALS